MQARKVLAIFVIAILLAGIGNVLNDGVKDVRAGGDGGNIIFEDDFDSLTLDNWIPFGSPSPHILATVEGRSGVFDNNGDSWCGSGVISKGNFNFNTPLTIESAVFLRVTDVTGCWATASIGITRENIPTGEGNCPTESYRMGVQFGISYVGDACWQSPEKERRHAYFEARIYTENGVEEDSGRINADSYIDTWHILKIVIGNDRITKFYVDGALIYTSSGKIHPDVLQGKRIWLGDRSSGSAGKAYHDYIKITGGDKTPVGDVDIISGYPKIHNNFDDMNLLDYLHHLMFSPIEGKHLNANVEVKFTNPQLIKEVNVRILALDGTVVERPLTPLTANTFGATILDGANILQTSSAIADLIINLISARSGVSVGSISLLTDGGYVSPILKEIRVEKTDDTSQTFTINKYLPTFEDPYNKYILGESSWIINNPVMISAHSPVDLLLELPNGLKVGREYIDNTITEYNDSNNVFYSGDTEPEFIFIINRGVGNYITKIKSTGTGTFDLDVLDLNATRICKLSYSVVPVTDATVATIDVSDKLTEFTMNMDKNGDGVVDDEKEPTKLSIKSLYEKSKDTPGFEMVVLIMALGAMIWVKRRRK